jgi:hypothetical protein
MMRETRRLQGMDDTRSQQQLEQKAAAAAALSSQLSLKQTLRRQLEEERNSVLATVESRAFTKRRAHLYARLTVPSPAALQKSRLQYAGKLWCPQR